MSILHESLRLPHFLGALRAGHAHAKRNDEGQPCASCSPIPRPPPSNAASRPPHPTGHLQHSHAAPVGQGEPRVSGSGVGLVLRGRCSPPCSSLPVLACPSLLIVWLSRRSNPRTLPVRCAAGPVLLREWPAWMPSREQQVRASPTSRELATHPRPMPGVQARPRPAEAGSRAEALGRQSLQTLPLACPHVCTSTVPPAVPPDFAACLPTLMPHMPLPVPLQQVQACLQPAEAGRRAGACGGDAAGGA